MPEIEGHARLAEFLATEIPGLAALYDRFAHALDPLDRGRDIAEETFNAQLVTLYDRIEGTKPSFRDFRRFVIVRCRRHLLAADKPPTT